VAREYHRNLSYKRRGLSVFARVLKASWESAVFEAEVGAESASRTQVDGILIRRSTAWRR
jgi:hypothetical protein